ncbi:DGAT1/2-independent enzyme synthesizing storage lipids [Culicoides brevitarsis]|uniref:DGAT1/2-independent enzyme synthesizing storage lipids n=1 Tax=Culicoides brevitarsis TaxID=469753 RepID=UPI00307C2F6D
MEENIENLNSTVVRFIGKYIDLDYTIWLYRVLTPFFIAFLLPCIFVLLIYFSILLLYIYRTYSQVITQAYNSNEFNYWNIARTLIALIWDGHAWLWHGYDVVGLENLPTNGPALIIYYHGAIPIDMYYFVARVYLKRDRLIYTVGDRFLFKLPGWAIIAEAFKVSPGTVQSCSKVLKDGNYLAISPGGVYEAQFGDNYYELLWGRRVGFAKVAIDAKVPIIPLFTENIREGFRAVNFATSFFLRLYNFLKFPVRPIYGGFPVKFRTYVGEPIEYDPETTPEELQTKTRLAIEKLINQYQRIPGSITHALLDRFRKPHVKDK